MAESEMEGELGIMDPNILEENVWEDEDGNLLEGKRLVDH